MTSTPTTVAIPTRQWSVKHYTILIALVLALVAGMFAVYSLTGSEVATTAANPAVTEQVRAGGDGCSTRLVITGGPLQGDTYNNTCGEPGGSVVRGGVQP